jgi:hypothetical protein
MKKLLSQGLMVAACLSFAASQNAMAQYLTPGQSRYVTPGQAVVTPDQATNSIVTSRCCGCQKVKPPVLSQELVLGPIGCCPGTPCQPGVEEVLPQLRVSPNGSTELHLMNPQSTAVRFNIRDLCLSYVIPANSERVIYLDAAMMANLPPGQPVTYDISTTGGQRLAYSCIIKEPIASYSISRPFAVREVPRYQEQVWEHKHKKPLKKRSPIRGYW